MPLIIDHSTDADLLFPKNQPRGLVPRDYKIDPPEMFAAPTEIKLIPRSEWSARIKERKELRARVQDVRDAGHYGQPIPYLDQNGKGYCWAHSTTHAVMLSRAVNNQPYVPLSAYAVAAVIMKGQDKGGWCGLSAKFAREVGIPSQTFWPQGSVDVRRFDTDAMRANAAMFKITEDWVDLTREVYDQNLTFDMLASCLLVGQPCPVDIYRWGHSVCAMDLVEVEPGSFGVSILNSWKDWGENGVGVLRGEWAIPNGALAIRSVSASTGVATIAV